MDWRDLEPQQSITINSEIVALHYSTVKLRSKVTDAGLDWVSSKAGVHWHRSDSMHRVVHVQATVVMVHLRHAPETLGSRRHLPDDCAGNPAITNKTQPTASGPFERCTDIERSGSGARRLNARGCEFGSENRLSIGPMRLSNPAYYGRYTCACTGAMAPAGSNHLGSQCVAGAAGLWRHLDGAINIEED